jgi:hypothetical protein
MLFDMMSGQRITSVPFAAKYRAFRSRLTTAEISAIMDRLDSMIDGADIKTSGWMPGADWSNTVFQPIYEKAARFDTAAAARCFGLMVWEAFMRRPERWTSGRFEVDGRDIGSRTYFRDRRP